MHSRCLPLCLLRVERYQTIGVLEMGMSAKGEIRKLASIAEPNQGVVTIRSTALNQNDEPAQIFTVKILVFRRSNGG